MKERWIVRLMVDRDPDVDEPPTCWDWQIDGADVVVVSGEVVGLVAPTYPHRQLEARLEETA